MSNDPGDHTQAESGYPVPGATPPPEFAPAPPAPPVGPPSGPAVGTGIWTPPPPGPGMPSIVPVDTAPTYQTRTIDGGAPMPPANATAAPRKGGAGLLLLGALLALIGLIAGAAMLVISASQQQSAVEDMARAPVGCETDLDFSETGTFYIYVETKGEIGDVDGSCSNTDHDYSFDDAPRVTLTLTDRDDEEVDLERTSGIDYDIGGFAGSVVRTFEIDDDGRYTLLVEARDEDAVVAVGRDVSNVGAGLGIAGIVVAAVGVLVGLVLVIMGLRRRRRPVLASPIVSGTSAWSPDSVTAPTSTTPTVSSTSGWPGSPGGPVTGPPTSSPAAPGSNPWEPPSNPLG